jgi:hypothetical protein
MFLGLDPAGGRFFSFFSCPAPKAHVNPLGVKVDCYLFIGQTMAPSLVDSHRPLFQHREFYQYLANGDGVSA